MPGTYSPAFSNFFSPIPVLRAQTYPMRVSLLLTLVGIIALSACSKSNKNEERWVEASQLQEVIVFKGAIPSLTSSSISGTEGSFYFQSRKLPEYVSRANESGIYFYTIQGDSLLLNTRQEKFYFKMATDGKSFTIGRFFVDPGGMTENLIFTKQ